jgi:hypothetical protein
MLVFTRQLTLSDPSHQYERIAPVYVQASDLDKKPLIVLRHVACLGIIFLLGSLSE